MVVPSSTLSNMYTPVDLFTVTLKQRIFCLDATLHRTLCMRLILGLRGDGDTQGSAIVYHPNRRRDIGRSWDITFCINKCTPWSRYATRAFACAILPEPSF
jgi:hypothetical protein